MTPSGTVLPAHALRNPNHGRSDVTKELRTPSMLRLFVRPTAMRRHPQAPTLDPRIQSQRSVCLARATGKEAAGNIDRSDAAHDLPSTSVVCRGARNSYTPTPFVSRHRVNLASLFCCSAFFRGSEEVNETACKLRRVVFPLFKNAVRASASTVGRGKVLLRNKHG